VPFASFDVEVARIVIASVPSAVLAFVIARTDPRGVVIFISRAFDWNAWYAQWTPLLMLIWWYPALAFLAECKPTLGVAMLAGPIREFGKLRIALGVSLALMTTSFLVEPHWPPNGSRQRGTPTMSVHGYHFLSDGSFSSPQFGGNRGQGRFVQFRRRPICSPSCH
jgi:hypothetical protein